MLAHVPNIGVLMVAGVLPLLWPRPQTSTPPATFSIQPRIVFVHEATTQFDPTAIAVPEENLQFTGDPKGGVLALGHRLSREQKPESLVRYAPPPRPDRVMSEKQPLAGRAQKELSRFTPSASEPGVFPSLTPSPSAMRYVLEGDLGLEGFTAPDWPDTLADELPGAWSIKAELTAGKDGRVEHVFLDEATESADLNTRIATLLYRARFSPGPPARRAILSIFHQPQPAASR